MPVTPAWRGHHTTGLICHSDCAELMVEPFATPSLAEASTPLFKTELIGNPGTQSRGAGWHSMTKVKSLSLDTVVTTASSVPGHDHVCVDNDLAPAMRRADR